MRRTDDSEHEKGKLDAQIRKARGLAAKEKIGTTAWHTRRRFQPRLESRRLDMDDKPKGRRR